MSSRSALAGKTRGAIGFALAFLVTFFAKKKVTEQNHAPEDHLKPNDLFHLFFAG